MRPHYVCISFFVLFLIPSLEAKEYLSPKMKSKEHVVKAACVMPAEVEFSKRGMKGSEGMTREAEQFAEDLRALVIKKLAERGVQVKEEIFSTAQLQSNEALLQTVLDTQRKYDTVAAQMYKKPKEIQKGRYSLSDEVALLPLTGDVDTIVFVHGSGIMLTGGKKAFGILVGGGYSDVSNIQITFVDAKSGDVLSMISLAKAGGSADEAEKGYGKGLTKAFKKMPMGSSVK